MTFKGHFSETAAGYVREARLRKSVTKDGRTIDQFVYAMVRG